MLASGERDWVLRDARGWESWQAQAQKAQANAATGADRGASMLACSELACSEKAGQLLRGEIARPVGEPAEPGRATEHRRGRRSPLPQHTHAGITSRLAQLLA